MKTTKIQVTIKQLETILIAAKNAQKSDDSLSSTLVLEQTREQDTHLGGDMVGVCIKSNYAECVGKSIYYNFDNHE